ncbi:MAG: hypothetical protein GC193_05335 [Cryomorphaceae bacterium]|nr:hypothetical protein [Cryomorphaceae bacterium]
MKGTIESSVNCDFIQVNMVIALQSNFGIRDKYSAAVYPCAVSLREGLIFKVLCEVSGNVSARSIEVTADNQIALDSPVLLLVENLVFGRNEEEDEIIVVLCRELNENGTYSRANRAFSFSMGPGAMGVNEFQSVALKGKAINVKQVTLF